jgi:hypothetical protein
MDNLITSRQVVKLGPIEYLLEPCSREGVLSYRTVHIGALRMVRNFQDFERLIFDLAAFLDPVAFEQVHDRSLEKRRRAAWRKAANRLSQPLAQ